MDRHRMKMTMSWIYQQRTTSDGLTLRIHAHVNKNGERERGREGDGVMSKDVRQNTLVYFSRIWYYILAWLST